MQADEQRYDSRPDTLQHIRRVQSLLADVLANLVQRAIVHDKTKLESPEVEVFDRETPYLKNLTYGSDEYKAALKRLGKGLEHHYANNRHHPEYWAFDELRGPGGSVWPEQVTDGTAIRQMSLLDLIEMLVDWKAASERHEDGDIWMSIEQNAERFGYDDQLLSVFKSTVRELGWLDKPMTEEERRAHTKAQFFSDIMTHREDAK